MQEIERGTGTIKAETDKIPAVKLETDKIPDIKTETDKISSIKTETDKISDIKTETDKIPDIKTETDKIADIKTETDKIPDIKTETDKIPDIKTETDKIETVKTEVEEIERHLHNYERWFEAAAVPSGEIHVADRIGSGSGSFQIDAGNNDWGAWVQLLGSNDTPAVAGNTFYDFHLLQITAAERTAEYYIQIAFGVDGATALTNNTYSDKPFKPQSVQGKPADIPITTDRQSSGTKAWARCKCPGQNTATLDFIFGLHEYPV